MKQTTPQASAFLSQTILQIADFCVSLQCVVITPELPRNTLPDAIAIYHDLTTYFVQLRYMLSNALYLVVLMAWSDYVSLQNGACFADLLKNANRHSQRPHRYLCMNFHTQVYFNVTNTPVASKTCAGRYECYVAYSDSRPVKSDSCIKKCTFFCTVTCIFVCTLVALGAARKIDIKYVVVVRRNCRF